MTKELTGKCLCGAVRWRCTAAPLWQAHCHCDSCRKTTASPFTSFIGMHKSAVVFSGDAPGTYASSPGVTRSFCQTCGTPMAFASTRWPEETHLYAASLDDPTLFAPTAHVNWGERVDWADLHDGLKKYTTSGDDGEIDKNAP